ncbi:MAG: sigma-54-dependent transcriptional regulator [Planctomycetota bacterium]|jgi:DNA-binding NtrC family response regulator
MAEILVIEDEPVLARNISESLQLAGHNAETAATGEDGLNSIPETRPDIIVLDYRLPGIDGLEVIRQIRAHGNTASIIMVTAHGNVDIAVEAMKRGANDFLTKPLDLVELRLVVERVLAHRATVTELSYFRDREKSESSPDLIIGQSKPMKDVKEFIGRITSGKVLASASPPSILITGETGTGKDLIARVIHQSGPRHAAQFVHVNCTAMPDHLVESELFGHVKGAFTDARSDKRGLFEIANGGTIFLDEIGHMKAELQAKLLSVLENRRIRPIGAMRERDVDIHVIAATNRDLEQAIKDGDFREDLLHRLRVLELHLPPLRERGQDIEELARHFLAKCAAKFAIPVEGFTEDTLKLIRAYDWPGNVRELFHSMESASLMLDGTQVRPEHVNIRPRTQGGTMSVSIPGKNAIEIDFSSETPKLEEIEYEIILAALEFAQHNASRAARILGISRDAIRYRLDKYRKQ